MITRLLVLGRGGATSRLPEAEGRRMVSPSELDAFGALAGSASEQSAVPVKSIAVGAGQAVTDADALTLDAERLRTVALGGAPAPIQTLAPIEIGATMMPARRSATAVGWPLVRRLTFGPGVVADVDAPMSFSVHP
ncbi:MAG: hypothetical protein MSC31_10555 [Solirubrobacteraceae bacterium MAG38_C4-C5]|nr:hypothetical protein [Candidatus Siliceabacter maunaloa]